MADTSKVIRNSGYLWCGVPTREYKTDATHFRAIRRHTLIGEGEGETAPATLLRYFEIDPGGYSSLERHLHPHTVVIIRGRGQVILGDRVEMIEHLDCVYVAPGTFHQFHATEAEPLGFLCIVDRERDRPQLPNEPELAQLRESPSVARLLKV
jgi:quercetin dioxygenase-like cupin family protein